MSLVHKYITGFVSQTFDLKTGKCISQDFTSGNSDEWVEEAGNIIDEPDVEDFPYDMQQPTTPITEEEAHAYFTAKVEEWLNDGPEEIVRVLTLWATRPRHEDARIEISIDLIKEYFEELNR